MCITSERCRLCFFLGRSTGTCDYIFIIDERRPCPPGDLCTVRVTRKEMEKEMKKPTWDTEAGRQMWEEGKNDAQIADEFRISAGTVASYRKKYWEKKPEEKAPEEKAKFDWENAKTLPPESLCSPAAKNPEALAPAGEDIKTMEQVELQPKKEESPKKKMQAATVEFMEILACATDGLAGIHAVCTASAIQSLWRWKSAEDLHRAKESIEYLLARLEG